MIPRENKRSSPNGTNHSSCGIFHFVFLDILVNTNFHDLFKNSSVRNLWLLVYFRLNVCLSICSTSSHPQGNSSGRSSRSKCFESTSESICLFNLLPKFIIACCHRHLGSSNHSRSCAHVAPRSHLGLALKRGFFHELWVGSKQRLIGLKRFHF